MGSMSGLLRQSLTAIIARIVEARRIKIAVTWWTLGAGGYNTRWKIFERCKDKSKLTPIPAYLPAAEASHAPSKTETCTTLRNTMIQKTPTCDSTQQSGGIRWYLSLKQTWVEQTCAQEKEEQTTILFCCCFLASVFVSLFGDEVPVLGLRSLIIHNSK